MMKIARQDFKYLLPHHPWYRYQLTVRIWRYHHTCSRNSWLLKECTEKVNKILLMPPVSRGNKGIFVKREFLSDTFKECDKENTHARVFSYCFISNLYSLLTDFRYRVSPTHPVSWRWLMILCSKTCPSSFLDLHIKKRKLVISKIIFTLK